MTWTEESKRQFDDWMRQERKWQKEQFHAEDVRDYSRAAYCYQMRWRCMHAALAALKPAPALSA